MEKHIIFGGTSRIMTQFQTSIPMVGGSNLNFWASKKSSTRAPPLNWPVPLFFIQILLWGSCCVMICFSNLMTPQCHEILVISWSFRWQVRLLCIWGLLRFLYSVAWHWWGPQFALLDVWWLRTEFISMGRGRRTRMWWSAMQTRWLSLVNTDLFTFFICAFVRCNWPEAAIYWNQSTKVLKIGIATPSRSWINQLGVTYHHIIFGPRHVR